MLTAITEPCRANLGVGATAWPGAVQYRIKVLRTCVGGRRRKGHICLERMGGVEHEPLREDLDPRVVGERCAVYCIGWNPWGGA